MSADIIESRKFQKFHYLSKIPNFAVGIKIPKSIKTKFSLGSLAILAKCTIIGASARFLYQCPVAFDTLCKIAHKCAELRGVMTKCIFKGTLQVLRTLYRTQIANEPHSKNAHNVPVREKSHPHDHLSSIRVNNPHLSHPHGMGFLWGFGIFPLENSKWEFSKSDKITGLGFNLRDFKNCSYGASNLLWEYQSDL